MLLSVTELVCLRRGRRIEVHDTCNGEQRPRWPDRPGCLHSPLVCLTTRNLGSTSGRALFVGHRLTLEHRAAAISAELASAGIPCILLKGPSFIRRLYEQGEPRTSAD